METSYERWQLPTANADEEYAIAVNPCADGMLLGKKKLIDGQWVTVPESAAKLSWEALGTLALVVNRALENHRRAGNNWPLLPTNTQEIIDAMHLKGTRTA